MSQRICLFYSHGPHYTRVLKELRKQYPEAFITALVPKSYPRTHLEGLADQVQETAEQAYGLRNLSGLRRLLSQIRAGHYDHFVVLFDSPKLRLLASRTGIPRRSCHTVDGRQFELERGIIPLLLKTVYRNIRGRIRYAYIRYIVSHRPINKG
jgi:ADP-heptose:LPS heptosyltransferase